MDFAQEMETARQMVETRLAEFFTGRGLEEAMRNAPALYGQAADRLFRAIKIGMRLRG